MGSSRIHFSARISNADETEKWQRSCDSFLSLLKPEGLLLQLTYSYATFEWSILSNGPKVYVLSFELMYDRPSHSASAWIASFFSPTGHF